MNNIFYTFIILYLHNNTLNANTKFLSYQNFKNLYNLIITLLKSLVMLNNN